MKWALALLLAFLALSLTAVAADENEEGLASWYGEPYNGRVAASGETYRHGGAERPHIERYRSAPPSG